PRKLIVVIMFPLLVVAAEFLGQVVFRMWGTAQSFSRVQTFWPPLIQIAAITGQAGVTYLVCLTNAFLAGLLVLRKEDKDFSYGAVFFGVIMGLSAVYSIASFYVDKPKEFIKVAALGWGESGPVGSWEQRLKRIDWLIGENEVDYRLIVYPEAALKIYFGEMDYFKYKLAEISRKHNIYQFAGFFDEHREYNGIMSVDPEGNTRELYYKTHLIKFIEDYNAGKGDVGSVDVDGVTVGAMICQDDNFQDIARRNRADGARVIVVPTNDWRQVKDYHAENMLYRAVENRVVIVRAASQGISRIIDPRGVVAAERDPFFMGIGEGGESILTVKVRLPRRGSVYSLVGNVFVYVCMAALAIGCIMGLMGVRKRKDSVEG
ncbi:MAG: nitrilase-related carbon-nitrogen hydrolase, partial [Pseudomonadota bacterium]